MILKMMIGILCVGLFSIAQAESFLITDASQIYDVRIDVACEEDKCCGEAKIVLYQKGKTKVFQQFTSEDLNFYLPEDRQPTVGETPMYGYQSGLMFGDFNFDGTEDIAIRSGNNGPYNGPSYAVYVYHKNRNKFVFSQELTDLTFENLGMFQVDPKRQRIITFSKGGCCYHAKREYAVLPKKGLVLLSESIEDAMRGDDQVAIIQRDLIRGRWKETVKLYPLKDIYPDN
ncbi:MAG: FG-GAP repeat protein [Acinetobacter populi]|jgi:hypothetical protein|uniref:FG-GAP repeat protein n=1 Tax=Acinetobacter populi TaxID=1582270 RepID=UPI002354622A|nr:FG-GAP repeat protein [Acinetobacter populi]MCH4246977.1 FG-GAP repeat protein [Acinetobacter populi]